VAVNAGARNLSLALVAFAVTVAAACGVVSAATRATSRAMAAAVFGKSVDVVPVSGKVLVRVPGKRSLPLRTQSQIPLGSLLDARAGTVRVISASGRADATRVGDFGGALFRVLQGSNDGGVTQMRLAGEDFSDCGGAAAAKIRHHRRWRAYADAEVGFSVRARNASSTTTTGRATWRVSDECDGTRTTANTGAVVLTTPERHRVLYPGSSAVDFCHPPQTTRPQYCLRVDSLPSADSFAFGLLLRGRQARYQLCVSRIGGLGRCAGYPMTYVSRITAAVGVVECDRTLPSGKFLARWRIGGHQLGVPLSFTSIGVRHRAAPGSCYNYPVARFGQSVAAIPLSGTVYVSAPGQKTGRLVSPRLFPVGSVVDARHGELALSVATNRRGGGALGHFFGGTFRVQQPASRGGLAVLRLVGGNFATCANSAPDTTVRQLFSTNLAVFGALGYMSTGAGFRVAGRYASAVGSGPIAWSTADECDGTRTLPVERGQISVSDAFQSSSVSFGEDELDSCSSTGSKPSFCLHVLAEPAQDTWGFGLGLQRGVKQYSLCISGPNRSSPCYGAPMTVENIRRGIGNVTCILNEGPGGYAVAWFLGTHELGAPLTFSATRAIVPQVPTISCVTGTPTHARRSRALRRSFGLTPANPPLHARMARFRAF
jgi:hypothetical protein